jgi:hypothetical protein
MDAYRCPRSHRHVVWLHSLDLDGPLPKQLAGLNGSSGHGKRPDLSDALLSPGTVGKGQSVRFEKGGFVLQTVQVSIAERAEYSFFAKDPQPALTPNPVEVALLASPKPTTKPRHHKTVLHNIHRWTSKPPAQLAARDTQPVQQQWRR